MHLTTAGTPIALWVTSSSWELHNQMYAWLSYTYFLRPAARNVSSFDRPASWYDFGG